MQRTRRLALVLTALGGLVALVAATGATGRSQTAPENVDPPVIASPYLVTVGTNLAGNPGKWDGTEPIKYAYQWLLCNTGGQGCQKISGATKSSYTIVKGDVGHTIKLRVTASNTSGSASADSKVTAEVPKSPQEPQQTSAPTISGSAVAGEKLTASTGSWKGDQPITFSVKWGDCDSEGNNCTANGATGKTYTVANSDVGRRIRIQVTGKNDAGSNSALSSPTAVVKAASGGGGGGGGTGNTVPVADVGPAGARLVVDKVVFNPNPVTSRNVPIQVKITVKDTNGKLVKGALVFFRSTPIVTSTPTDAPTDSNGTVTYSVQPRSDFPIKNGYSVQFFVKAYRSGDPSLAGISGTRLVQVATHTP